MSNVGGIARLWEVATGKESRRFIPANQAPGDEAERALLSPDGRLLAAYFVSRSKRDYGIVYLWSLISGDQKEIKTEIYLDWRFSDDSRFLALTAIADRGKPAERSLAEIWDSGTGKLLKTVDVPPEWRGAYSVAFSPDSKLLAIGGYKKFGIFSVDTGRLLAFATHHRGSFLQDSEMPNQLNHVEFSPDGKMLLTAGNDNNVKLWRITE